MILQALRDRFEAQSTLPAYGWADRDVAAILTLDHGRLSLIDVRPTGKEKRRSMRLPAAPAGRTSKAIRPGTIADNAAYIFGTRLKECGKAKDKQYNLVPSKSHQTAYLEHFRHLSAVPEVEAVINAYANGEVDRVCKSLVSQIGDKPKDSILFSGLVVWRVDGVDVHEAAKAEINRRVDGQQPARLHPPIQGVLGGAASGPSLCSWNFAAATSRGLKQGANAPMRAVEAHAYATALSDLVRNHSWQRGGTVIVWWTGNGNQVDLDQLLDGNSGDARKIMISEMINSPVTRSWAAGDHTAAYLATLQLSSASRLSVVEYHSTTVSEIGDNVRRWWSDMGDTGYPSLFALASGLTAVGETTDRSVTPTEWRRVWRAALSGGPIPDRMAMRALDRCLSQGISRPRLALLNLYLRRNCKLVRDMKSTTPYRLGLYVALVSNVGYRVTASSHTVDTIARQLPRRPNAGFVRVGDRAEVYLGQLMRRGGKDSGFALWARKQLAELLDGVGEIPANWPAQEKALYFQGLAAGRRHKLPQVEATAVNEATLSESA